MGGGEDDDERFYSAVAAGFDEDTAQAAMYERLKRRGMSRAKTGAGHV
jgi:hypothetical protein